MIDPPTQNKKHIKYGKLKKMNRGINSENPVILAMIRSNNDSGAWSAERPKDSESVRINCNGNMREKAKNRGKEGILNKGNFVNLD